MLYTVYQGATQVRQPQEKLRILHAADLHLGAGRAQATAKERERKAETFASFQRLIRFAQEKQVHLLLLAGDFLEANQITPAEMRAVAYELEQLPCPILLAPGNHDPFVPGSFYTEMKLADHIHVFQKEWEALFFPSLKTTVWGAGFTRMAVTESLWPKGSYRDWLKEIRESDSHNGIGSVEFTDAMVESEQGLQLACIHGQIASSSSHAPYNPLPESQLLASDLDYIALGHVHKRQVYTGKTSWAYSGSLQGNGFDELDAHGALYIEISENQPANIQFLPLAQREFRILPLDLTYKPAASALALTIIDQVEKQNPDFKHHYYRLLLRGEIPIDARISLAQVLARLKDYFYYVELEDEFKLHYDLKTLAQERTLRGLVVRAALQDIQQASDAQTRDNLEKALHLVLQAFDGDIYYEEKQA